MTDCDCRNIDSSILEVMLKMKNLYTRDSKVSAKDMKLITGCSITENFEKMSYGTKQAIVIKFKEDTSKMFGTMSEIRKNSYSCGIFTDT